MQEKFRRALYFFVERNEVERSTRVQIEGSHFRKRLLGTDRSRWIGCVVKINVLLLFMSRSIVRGQPVNDTWYQTIETVCENSNYKDRGVSSFGTGDSRYERVDSYGDGCDYYDSNVYECGDLDDDDFTANQMCCACGGGQEVNLPRLSSICVNTDNVRVHPFGGYVQFNKPTVTLSESSSSSADECDLIIQSLGGWGGELNAIVKISRTSEVGEGNVCSGRMTDNLELTKDLNIITDGGVQSISTSSITFSWPHHNAEDKCIKFNIIDDSNAESDESLCLHIATMGKYDVERHSRPSVTRRFSSLLSCTSQNMRYHFFISHMQAEASGDVGTMYHLFANMGINCWYVFMFLD